MTTKTRANTTMAVRAIVTIVTHVSGVSEGVAAADLSVCRRVLTTKSWFSARQARSGAFISIESTPEK